MTASIKDSPKYEVIRTDVSAVDVLPVQNPREGVNTAGYDIIQFQIVPTGGANPDVEVLSWCEEAGQFISANPAADFTGIGADTPYEFTIMGNGRIFFVAVTGLAAGAVTITASGRRTGSL